MTKEEEKIFDKVLDKMDDNTKNMLIKLLMTHDKKDIWIQIVPVYEDMVYEGHTLFRYIKETKYAIGVKHEAASYVDTLKGDEPHIINFGEN